jgi:hypothetical protein
MHPRPFFKTVGQADVASCAALFVDIERRILQETTPKTELAAECSCVARCKIAVGFVYIMHFHSGLQRGKSGRHRIYPRDCFVHVVMLKDYIVRFNDCSVGVTKHLNNAEGLIYL